MPLEPNVYALWAGKQVAKGTEQTTAAKRFIQVGGDLNIARDDGQEQWSDMSKYGARTKWINSLLGSGNPTLEATANETGWLLWAGHGAETFTAGTDNVWTLSANPTTGTFDLKIWDGEQYIIATSVANTVTSSALDTALEAAFLAAGYGANQVTCAGGPLNTTPIAITFNGTGTANALATAKRPFYLSKANDTTSPAVVLTNTTPGVCAKHSFVPQTTAGFWLTFMKRIGTSVLQRQSFIDCLIGGYTLEGSTSTKALHITPTLLSLDPAKILTSDPTLPLPSGIENQPLLYNESASQFIIGTGGSAVAVPAQSEFTLVLNEDRSPVYGDDVIPFDLVVGQPSATISVTLIFDSVTMARWNELVYGSAAPTAGTKPNRFLPSNGSYSCDFKQKDGQGNLTGREIKVTIPSVAWSLPDAPAANPGGGAVNVTLAGTMEPPGGVTQPYTIDVFNTDVAAYS